MIRASTVGTVMYNDAGSIPPSKAQNRVNRQMSTTLEDSEEKRNFPNTA